MQQILTGKFIVHKNRRILYSDRNSHDLRPIFKTAGILLMLCGAIVLFIGIIEIYCYYLFSKGGQFYYQGFGFGSFMFANLTFQIWGYYGIAAVLLFLGYAHFTPRLWVRNLMLALINVWWIVGIPMLIIFFLIAVTAKQLSIILIILLTLLLAAAYFFCPFLLRRGYKSHRVTTMLERYDPQVTRFSTVPVNILSICIMDIFFAGMLHVPLLLNGIFPFFGKWIFGLQGIIFLAISIMVFLFLAWGIYTQGTWAWWGTLIWVTVLTASTGLTFLKSEWMQLLEIIRFPAYEITFLMNMPIKGWHMALFNCLPLLATDLFLITNHKYFGIKKRTPIPEILRSGVH